MRINPAALQRIIESGISGEHVAAFFQTIASTPHISGATLALSLSFQKPGDVISEGDFIPTLIFNLRPPVNMEESNAGLPGPTLDSDRAAVSK